jgi:hypothetical protein
VPPTCRALLHLHTTSTCPPCPADPCQTVRAAGPGPHPPDAGDVAGQGAQLLIHCEGRVGASSSWVQQLIGVDVHQPARGGGRPPSC